MTVGELSKLEGFSAITMPDPDRNVEGGYCGDLLSWVMGRAKCGNAWFTIMSNVNTVAVATLCDVSCVILAEGVSLDDDVKNAAKMRGVNVLSTQLSSFDAAKTVAAVI